MTPPEAASRALHARVRRFIAASLADDPSESFERLARDIAEFQREHVEPVRRLFEASGFEPSDGDLERIPGLPTEAFRLRRIAAHSIDERCFQTSGTTATARGAHPMRTTRSYAQAALAWGRQLLFPDRDSMRVVSLTASELSAPDSSLSFMIARFGEALGGDLSWHLEGDGVDIAAVQARIASATEPVLVTGTSFAFVHLLDRCPQPAALALPDGSRVMQTGGFKGRSREVDAAQLRGSLARLFALPRARVVGEYGMTELSSQLYQPGVATGSEDEAYFPPPWLSVRALEPETLEPLPPGATGIARFVDLANVDGAMAVLTADRIRRRDDGAIELFGRQPGATPRGCSLSLEPLLS